MEKRLIWITPILATITVLLEIGHLTHVNPEVPVMVAAIVTALVGFYAAFQNPAQGGVVTPPQPQPTPKK